MPYSGEQIRMARRADLVGYLQSRGFELKREGEDYRLPGHGGLIVRGNRWYHHSAGRGGNAVDFLVEFMGFSFRQAIMELTGHEEMQAPAIRASSETHPKPLARPEQFELPPKGTDTRRLSAYLLKTRGLPPSLVGLALAKGLLYQDAKGNAVFPCYDRDGIPRGAFIRGTSPRHPFKGMAPGSDGRYPWHWPPEETGHLAAVCESPIDCMSLVVLRPGLRCAHLVSLNGSRSR